MPGEGESKLADNSVSVREISKVYRIFESLWSRFLCLLSFSRLGRFHEVRVLDRVSLEIRRGECVGVMGPNGAGKSTLLKIVTGALLPTSGELKVSGRITMLDLGANMNGELSGRDNLTMAA